MKRFLQTIAIAFMCGILVSPMAEAADRRNPSSGGGRAGTHTTTPSHSPGGGGNHNSGGQRPGGNRPGGGGNHNPGGQRPGGNQPGNGNYNPGGQRPGGNQPGNGNYNPGGQRPGGNQPGNGNYNPGGQRPGGNQPGHPGGYNPRPRPNPPHGHPTPPPAFSGYRPMIPPPPPPRAWNPGPRAPRFSTILGLTIGSAISASINALINSGYNVYSYGDNIVYLNNVSQFNYMWPTATLYYNYGGLSRGEFVYFTSYPDHARYNSVYASLVSSYGVPYTTNALTNGMQTIWYGPDGRFITLNYAPQYDRYGSVRYYTTLNFGF